MAKRIELEPGTQFGMLTVVERAPDRIDAKGRHWSYFHCLCQCGNEVDVNIAHLRSGHTKSCGCYHPVKRVESLIGQTFGKLTVLDWAPDRIHKSGRRTSRFHCICECGTEVDVDASHLKDGSTKSCGCYHPGKRVESLIGQTFGKLTVLDWAPDRINKDGSHRSRFHCLCQCGREVDVDASKLKNGHTRSCGCLHPGGQYGVIDRVGQVFGKLTVLERTEDYITKSGHRRVLWKCRCECGRETTVRAIKLRKGDTKTCGYCQLNEKYQDHAFVTENGKKSLDLTGLTFGRLTVIGPADPLIQPSGQQKRCWIATCSCGNPEPVRVQAYALTSGVTQSCGCLQKEAIKKYNRYEIMDDYVIGFTEEGVSFTFDLEDFEKIQPYYWGVRRGYISTTLADGSRLCLHRLIMGLEKDDMRVVDHKNHDTHENRRWNLRIATSGENSRNQKLNKRNTSGITGVGRTKNGRWYAHITFNGKAHHLGTYDTKEEAAAARKTGEDKYFGEFSYANSMASAIPPEKKSAVGIDALLDVTVSIDVIDPVPEFDVLPPDPVPEFEVLPDLVSAP